MAIVTKIIPSNHPNVADGYSIYDDGDQSNLATTGHDPTFSYYIHPDGHATASENECWVNALFESLEAAKSWAGRFDQAEARFKEINPGDGPRNNLVGVRPTEFVDCTAARSKDQ